MHWKVVFWILAVLSATGVIPRVPLAESSDVPTIPANQPVVEVREGLGRVIVGTDGTVFIDFGESADPLGLTFKEVDSLSVCIEESADLALVVDATGFRLGRKSVQDNGEATRQLSPGSQALYVDVGHVRLERDASAAVWQVSLVHGVLGLPFSAEFIVDDSPRRDGREPPAEPKSSCGTSDCVANCDPGQEPSCGCFLWWCWCKCKAVKLPPAKLPSA
jgi:hypothetical protein